MRKIAGRLDESRQFGVDPAVIGNMERGLADVYQALRELKPAESLAGFEDAIRNLSFKIEQMGGVSHDPGFRAAARIRDHGACAASSRMSPRTSSSAPWPMKCAACRRKSNVSPPVPAHRTPISWRRSTRKSAR